MKIRKVAQSVGVLGKILNLFSNSDKDTYSCDYLNNNDTYSTNEIKTNKRWIDGKPIYRKVIIGDLDDAPFNHGITNAVFHKINAIYLSSNNNTFPIPSTRPNYGSYAIGLYVSPTQILFDKGSGVSNCHVEVTLEYTKTTD